MFDALPNDNLGLEWEPCHQLVYLIDPMPQIRKWAPKFFHVHGKDATVRWDVVREHGVFGKVSVRADAHARASATPTGRASSASSGSPAIRGPIDIEGWHDPVYRDELEMTGQVRALDYLKQCRGGARVRRQSGLRRIGRLNAGQAEPVRRTGGAKPEQDGRTNDEAEL